MKLISNTSYAAACPRTASKKRPAKKQQHRASSRGGFSWFHYTTTGERNSRTLQKSLRLRQWPSLAQSRQIAKIQRFSYTPPPQQGPVEMSFQCTVVTPEQQAFDAPVTQAILPAHDGLLGILTDRAPLLVRLGSGPLRLDLAGGAGGRSQYFFVSGGVAQMKDNRLTIVTGEATSSDQISYEAARAEYAEAAAAKTSDDRSAKEKEERLQKARVKQAMAKK
jgi:F-type H+-transporting ATPase subunit epsilon